MPSASKVDDDDDERRPLLSSSSPSVAQNEVVDDGNDDDDDDSAGSSFSCRRCVSMYVPIEPLLLGYAFARVIIIVLTGFYFFDEASRWYGDPSMSSLNPCGTNQSAGGHAADQTRAENVQKEALQLTMVGSFSVYMTAVLPALFIGPLTDRIGRRLGFALPVLGVVLRGIVFLLVLGTGASVYFIYIGTVLEGLGGGFGTLLMTSFSAAADVTKPGRQRALRICIIEAVQVLGSALAGFIAGQWRRVNYTQPLMLAAAVGVLTLMFALWAMPETLSSSSSSRPAPAGTEDPAASGQKEAGREGQHQDQSLGRTGHGEINTDFTVNNPDVGHGYGPHSVESSAEEGARRSSSSSSNNNNYVSFSPTGHRLSHQARLYGSQGRCAPSQQSLHGGGGAGGVGSIREGDETEPETTTPPEPLPDSTQASPKRTSSSSSSSSYCSLALRNIRNSWGVYFRSDDAAHPGRRCVLLLCFVCFLLTVAVNFSKPGVETVFRLGELCWNAVQETEFDSGWLVQHWLFILVALHVLQGRLKARNVSVALVGCVSALLAPLIFSMATLPGISGTLANTLVFVSAGSGTLARALIPMLRAMSSAVVSLDEQGALFASYACVELAGAAVFDLAASQVYKATVHLWKGIIFVIMTFFFVVVLILLIILSVLQRRWEQKAAEDTERRSAPSQGTGSPE